MADDAKREYNRSVSTSKIKRAKRPAAGSPPSDRLVHLHVVIDGDLQKGLEAHARKLEGKPKSHARPNVSAAARHLLRTSLGLPA